MFVCIKRLARLVVRAWNSKGELKGDSKLVSEKVTIDNEIQIEVRETIELNLHKLFTTLVAVSATQHKKKQPKRSCKFREWEKELEFWSL